MTREHDSKGTAVLSRVEIASWSALPCTPRAARPPPHNPQSEENPVSDDQERQSPTGMSTD